MRLIDADELLEEWDERTDDHRITDSEFHRMINEDLPLIELGWHYPSRGEYPPSGEEVLCWLWGTTPDVGCWNEKDELWHFDEFEEETVECWQYIVPPKEKA